MIRELFSSYDTRLFSSEILVKGESSDPQPPNYGLSLHKVRVFYCAQKYSEAGMKTENRTQFT